MAAQAHEEEGKAVVNKYQNQAKFAVPVDRHTVSAHCRARGYSCNYFVVSQGRRRQDPVPGVNELVTVIEVHLEIGDVGEVMFIEGSGKAVIQRGAMYNVLNIHPETTRSNYSYD